jgi:precorrin-2 dehydrogenase/sirohydrochlorin ferrochelatase
LRSLTVNLDLTGSKALVLGCGKVGLRKLSRLLGTGAEITAVEPRPSPELLRLERAGAITLLESFSPELLEGARLVFAASGEGVPREVLEAARAGRILLNSADEPGLGTFALPAVAEDGALTVSVSTGGAFPALSAVLAARLRESFRGWGGYVELLGSLRSRVLASPLPARERSGILRRLAEDPELPELVRSGRRPEAMRLAAGLLSPVDLPPDTALPGFPKDAS